MPSFQKGGISDNLSYFLFCFGQKRNFIESFVFLIKNEKYAILYTVTARMVYVIDIYHTAINPETITKLPK